MAYIHCHACSWEQDDFWKVDGHNPFKDDNIKEWRDLLSKCLSGEKVDIGKDFCLETGIPYKFENGNYVVEPMDLLRLKMKWLSQRVNKMTWLTFDEFRADENKICPACGSDDLDID